MQLSEEQKEYMNGNLLGDGGLKVLRTPTANSYFFFSQSKQRTEYVKGLAMLYAPFVKNEHIKITNWKGKKYSAWCFYTISDPYFTELRQKWYSLPYKTGGIKLIPEDLKLTWRTAALWACDDGSDMVTRRTFRLSSHCFNTEGIDLLVHRLKSDLQIIAKVYLERSKPVINMMGDNGGRFIEGITPYVPWDCLQYKLQWRDSLRPNTSGTKGVSRVRDRWQAHIMHSGIRKVKYFKTKDEAVLQREQWNQERMNNAQSLARRT